jgi:hypothetical protein
VQSIIGSLPNEAARLSDSTELAEVSPKSSAKLGLACVLLSVERGLRQKRRRILHRRSQRCFAIVSHVIESSTRNHVFVIFAVFCADSLLLYLTLRALTYDSEQARPNFAEDFGELSRAASLGRLPMILSARRRSNMC